MFRKFEVFTFLFWSATVMIGLQHLLSTPRRACRYLATASHGVRGSLEASTGRSFEEEGNGGPSVLRSPKTVTVIGAPLEHGQPLLGTNHGPGKLRAAGLRTVCTSLGWRYNDQGDIPMDAASHPAAAGAQHVPNALNCSLVGAANEALFRAVRDAARAGTFVLTLGGDHAIGVGTIAGALAARPDVGVVWVDAHADINTPRTSGSGNMHGMPVGLALKLEGTEGLPGFQWLDEEVPALQPDQVAYIGLRDLDDGERRVLRELRAQGMFVSTMQDVDAVGIGQVVRSALEALGPDRPLHLSYDIDALDPSLAPATGTVVRGGLSFREGHYIAEALAETGRLGSMDMVEVNEELGDSAGATMTTEMGLVLMASALGSRIL